jgi:hypothetical protein
MSKNVKTIDSLAKVEKEKKMNSSEFFNLELAWVEGQTTYFDFCFLAFLQKFVSSSSQKFAHISNVIYPQEVCLNV